MAEKRAASKFLETKYFGLAIGVLVFLIILAVSSGTVLIKFAEEKMLDLNFRLKNSINRTRVQEGVSVVQSNLRISPDILIVGIDDKSLARFGRWPFDRYRHADLFDAFSRIKNQADRERAVFLDVFFIEPSTAPEDDALLVSSIKSSGRVFLETVLTDSENPPGTEDEFFSRQDILNQRLGTITRIEGDWLKVSNYPGVESPLKPYARAVYGFGHANYLPDGDEVYRRQPLVAKLSRLVAEIPFDQLTVDTPIDRDAFERFAWVDRNNVPHEIPYPLTPGLLSELSGQLEKSAPQRVVEATDTAPEQRYYVVRKYRDTFIPSITLSLALEYMHKKLSDIEVALGRYIRIPSPETFNRETQSWEPYRLIVSPPLFDQDGNQSKEGTYRTVPELRIPIDETGQMLINFMGEPSSADPEEHQTFTVRSYSGYAASPPPADPAKWPSTKKLGNTILMVGPFTTGIASDQKPTPFGLMYGVEMHANALNTILMDNFLQSAGWGVNTLILFVMIMLVSFMVSRLSTVLSLVAALLAIVVFFFTFMLLFEFRQYIITFSAPAIGIILTFLAVVAYRTVFEERDKRRIRDMFGKYVSPAVRDEILKKPPELGGVDKELTVFFSDIRGFTTLSESLSPQELVNHLNLYLTAMTDLILSYLGTLDKYVGDEIMAFWGAPLPQEDHALLACKCALKQMEALRRMNAAWPPEKRLDIGIGLNTGIMTVGNMGSIGRMNYTLMGDMVNLGARLEGTNKQYFTNIILSEFTYSKVKDNVIARELDYIRVKGKNKPVVIYELVELREGESAEPPAPVDAKGRATARA